MSKTPPPPPNYLNARDRESMCCGLAERMKVCRGSIRTMMVTGDYHGTGLAVARGVGMVPTDSPVVIIQAQAEFCPSTKGLVTMPSALKSPSRVANQAVSFGSKDQQEEDEALEGSVAMPSAQVSSRPALKVPHTAVSFGTWDQEAQEAQEETPEGSLAMPLVPMRPRPALSAPHRAVSFGTSDQNEEEEAPEVSLATPPAVMSPRPALVTPHQAVSFVPNDQQGGQDVPYTSLATLPTLKRPRLAPLATRSSRRSVSFRIPDQLEEEGKPPQGQLRFQLDNGDAFQDGDALRAFTSIAQVGPCADRV